MKKPVLIIVSVFFLLSCRSVQVGIDRYSLNRNKNAILEDFSPGSPDQLNQYISGYDLNILTGVEENVRPSEIIPLNTWQIKTEKKIDYRKWIFSSSFFKEEVPGDSVFYVYQQNPWRDSKVILFVPGFGVSDFAFRFLKNFFTLVIDEGYNIVFYIPPFHMDRQEEGKPGGSGLLTSKPLDNVQKLTNSVKEIREVYRYLKNQNVRSIGLWGGSMGGAFSLLLQSMESFDHLALMIPVIDWNSFITPETVMVRYNEKGFKEEIIKEAFSLISPVNFELKIARDRVFIQAAEFDQLIPVNDIIKYSAENSIDNLNIYPAGHATILLHSSIYEDYGGFLASLN